MDNTPIPHKTRFQYPVKLEKGDHSVQVQIRHQSEKVLARFKDTPLVAKIKLASAITPDPYSTLNDAILGEGKKFGKTGIRAGQIVPVYFSPILDDK